MLNALAFLRRHIREEEDANTPDLEAESPIPLVGNGTLRQIIDSPESFPVGLGEIDGRSGIDQVSIG